MRTLLWITRPEMAPFTAGQHTALQAWWRKRGWDVTVAHHQNRLMWRQRQRFDVVVWTFVPTQLETWLARRVAAVQVGLVHELPTRQETLPRLDHWLVASVALGDALCTMGVSRRDVSPAMLPPAPADASALNIRQELGLDAATPLVYAAGPAVVQAGNRIAIWALNILNYVHPEVRLVLHGQGVERERLEQFSRSIDERRRVHFVPAATPTAALVAQADQVWLPRQWDGVPDALFFALQLSKVIIAARQPSLSEWLSHEKNALLVRPDQPADWAAAAHRLWCHSEEAAGLAAAAGATKVSAQVCLDDLEAVTASPLAA